MAVRPKPNPGLVSCLGLKCEKKFHSRDKATNRLCPACTKKRDERSGLRVYKGTIAEPE